MVSENRCLKLRADAPHESGTWESRKGRTYGIRMDEYGRVVTQSELPPHSYTALVRDSQAMVE